MASHKVLYNRYFIMRHGKSEANLAEIILSDPQEGTRAWGLCEEGRKQVEQSVTTFPFEKPPRIISSDFTRARETAELAAKWLNLPEPLLDIRLRERFFGDWEKTDHSNYQKVWADDRLDGTHCNHGVESALEVQQRTSSLILELEEKSRDQLYLLVSHGDALQILQTWFLDTHASRHRELEHLDTAEIREMFL